MLQLNVVITPELWDAKDEKFIKPKIVTIELEHSLLSISKWESKWRKPFLSSNSKTFDETIDYIRCMTITQNVDPIVYDLITDSNIEEVDKYINTSMTATWFSNNGKTTKHSTRQITSELVYYWMIILGIPWSCEEWHFSRLMTLIEVYNAEHDSKANKMTNSEILELHSSINEHNRKRYNSKG